VDALSLRDNWGGFFSVGKLYGLLFGVMVTQCSSYLLAAAPEKPLGIRFPRVPELLRPHDGGQQ
jgi:hypothetical protein